MNLFTKPLHWMNYDQLAESVAKMGLDGLDLTVRPQGHVLPENIEWEYLNNAEKELPYEERAQLAISRIKQDCDFYKSVLHK